MPGTPTFSRGAASHGDKRKPRPVKKFGYMFDEDGNPIDPRRTSDTTNKMSRKRQQKTGIGIKKPKLPKNLRKAKKA